MGTKHVEIYRAADSDWRWRAKSANGKIVASGEGYSRKWSAKRSAKKLFPDWPIVLYHAS